MVHAGKSPGRRLWAGLLVAVALCLVAPAEAADSEGEAPPLSQDEIDAGEAMLELALKPWTGDLDGMIERRMVRVLVDYDPIHYFTDRFRQRGLTYEIVSLFEKQLNEARKLTGDKRVRFVFVPVDRAQLITGLVDGTGDLAAGNITITPARQEKVDFSAPFTDQVEEVLVSGPGYPTLEAAEGLSGQEVAVKPSSSYAESLAALNQQLQAAGKAAVAVTDLDEDLGEQAVAELVAAGVYPATVMDRYLAEVWVKVYPKLVLQEKVVLRQGGQIAWAFRKESPDLKRAVDAFVAKHQVGSLETNILINRYLRDVGLIQSALDEKEQAKYRAMVGLFQDYAGRYGFDWLLLIAQGYQESGLDQTKRSPSGAVGIMQLLPKTAAADPIGIDDISKAEPNVHAGAKYLRYLADQYFDDPAIQHVDRHLFAFAAYNAGPNRIQKLRQEAVKRGLDPNRWFDNVEIVVADRVGRETVDYVANIFKYYITYKRIEERNAAEIQAKDAQK